MQGKETAANMGFQIVAAKPVMKQNGLKRYGADQNKGKWAGSGSGAVQPNRSTIKYYIKPLFQGFNSFHQILSSSLVLTAPLFLLFLHFFFQNNFNTISSHTKHSNIYPQHTDSNLNRMKKMEKQWSDFLPARWPVGLRRRSHRTGNLKSFYLLFFTKTTLLLLLCSFLNSKSTNGKVRTLDL